MTTDMILMSFRRWRPFYMKNNYSCSRSSSQFYNQSRTINVNKHINKENPLSSYLGYHRSLSSYLGYHRMLHTSHWNCKEVERKSNPSTSKITVFLKKKSGQVLVGTGVEGENLLDVVMNNNLDLDGFGACEGTLACSTCHLILKQTDYDGLPSPPSDEELDMLDLAYGLTETSRLGCQVYLTKKLDGLEVEVPEGINDQRTGE